MPSAGADVDGAEVEAEKAAAETVEGEEGVLLLLAVELLLGAARSCGRKIDGVVSRDGSCRAVSLVHLAFLGEAHQTRRTIGPS